MKVKLNFFNQSSKMLFFRFSFREKPLLLDIDNQLQKDYTSISLDSVKFPDGLYGCDKNIELNIKSPEIIHNGSIFL